MLTLKLIKRNYKDEIFRRNPKAVIVEYLQYELLDSIFKQKNSDKISFIGGTAVRIVYNSSRFSEDLDFDNFGLSYSDFEKIMTKVVADMENKGFSLEFRSVEKGAYHCYIKFPDLLFDNNLSINKGEKILVRIDMVRKESRNEPEVYTINGFDVYRKIRVNSAEVILSQKLVTILQRKREKGRDIYDVSYLLGMVDPDYDFLKEEYNITRDEVKEKMLSRIETLQMTEMVRDVASFLIKPEDTERILHFKEYIEQRL